MSNYSADRLYRLLPAVYRQRDAELAEQSNREKGPLQELIEIVAEQAGVVERDVLQLYENWFAETCESWVVPYIGDLIGVRGTRGAASRRAEVANTLGYRRAKGTAAVLEQLARDVTGWPARAVEFFERLETTQHVNHVRLHNLRTPDLRRANELELLNGPFETANHTAEVRRIAVERGRYNVPNVGLFLWRLQAYPLDQVMPRPRPADASNRNFFFNVLGMDEPLFNAPEAEASAAHIAEEINVPAPIRRRAFHAALKSYYGQGLSIEVWDPNWKPAPGYDPKKPIPPDDIVACDLTDWNRPRPADKLAVDPVLGRLSFPPGKPTDPAQVRVTYHHGFSDDLGGGMYEREASFTRVAEEKSLAVGVSADSETIQEALSKWDGKGSAVIEILDSRTYAENLAVPKIPPSARLEIRARNEQRPTLLLLGPEDLVVLGDEKSRFEVNGLLIAGKPLRITGKVDHVRIQHTTLAPGRSIPALIVEPGEAKVTIERSILGAVRTHAETRVEARDSIVDAVNAAGQVVVPAYADKDDDKAPGGPLSMSRCTVIGPVITRQLDLAENSLFVHPVTAERRQEGCARFSFFPEGSRTPRRHRCQPDGGPSSLRPRFTSLRYGDPGYCQLTLDTPREIRRGAEDESEMGVFSSLRQPQREDGLRLRFEEYLRVGLEAGIFFAT